MGAIAERPKPGATVGETFSCLIGGYTVPKLAIFSLETRTQFRFNITFTQ